MMQSVGIPEKALAADTVGGAVESNLINPSPEQFLNAPLLILVTLLGMVIEVKE